MVEKDLDDSNMRQTTAKGSMWGWFTSQLEPAHGDERIR